MPMQPLGVRISHISKQRLLEQIKIALTKKRRLWIVTANPEILLKAWKNKEYKNIIHSADYVVADGVGITLAVRLLYRIKLERISGANLAEEILHLAANTDKRVFLLGGTSKANQDALEHLGFMFRVSSFKFQGLGGNFTEKEAIKKITAYNPDILLVALGAPKQEFFIKKFLQLPISKKQFPNIMLGIGGTVDFLANPRLRAPKFLQSLGLEWLWRLLRQPWRLPRIINAVVLFPLIVLWQRLKNSI